MRNLNCETNVTMKHVMIIFVEAIHTIFTTDIRNLNIEETKKWDFDTTELSRMNLYILCDSNIAIHQQSVPKYTFITLTNFVSLIAVVADEM